MSTHDNPHGAPEGDPFGPTPDGYASYPPEQPSPTTELPREQTPGPAAAGRPDPPDGPGTFDPGAHGPDPRHSRSGRHLVNIGHLVFGVAFLGLTVVWLLVVTDVVLPAEDQWVLPVPWLVAGAVGLLAMLLGSRHPQARWKQDLKRDWRQDLRQEWDREWNQGWKREWQREQASWKQDLQRQKQEWRRHVHAMKHDLKHGRGRGSGH